MRLLHYYEHLTICCLLLCLLSCEQVVDNAISPKYRYYILNQTYGDIKFALYKSGEVINEGTIIKGQDYFIGNNGIFFTDSVAFYNAADQYIFGYRNLYYEDADFDVDISKDHFYVRSNWHTSQEIYITYVVDF